MGDDPREALQQYLSLGETLDERYRLESVIDTGSFGAVYRAHDRRLDVTRAIKALPPHSDSSGRDTSHGRFEREMCVIARLNHESIVTLYDYGSTHDDIGYMVLEYIEGRDLDEMIDDEGAMTLEGALTVTRQLTEGLQIAHEEGIIHRDLKPGNIMLVSMATGYRAKLLDFGMAKLLATLNGETIAQLTREGKSVGTPRYIAPEQARGSDAVGPATDLYSLGLLVYEMLVGRKAVRADGVKEALRLHLTPEPLSLPGLDRHPEPVVELVRDLTRVDPEQRISSASEVLRRLEKLVESPLVAADALLESQELFGPPLGSTPSDSTSNDAARDATPPSVPEDVAETPEMSQKLSEDEDGIAEKGARNPRDNTPDHDPDPASSPERASQKDETLEVDWEAYQETESHGEPPSRPAPQPSESSGPRASSSRSSATRRHDVGHPSEVVAALFTIPAAFIVVSAQCAGWSPLVRALLGASPIWMGIVGGRVIQGRGDVQCIRTALVTSMIGIAVAHGLGVESLARELARDSIWFLEPFDHLLPAQILEILLREPLHRYAYLLEPGLEPGAFEATR